MSVEQEEYYQTLLGDTNARISVSRDEAEKCFGTGGGIMVTVSLTCGQTEDKIRKTVALAYQIADEAVKFYTPQIKQDLLDRGLLR